MPEVVLVCTGEDQAGTLMQSSHKPIIKARVIQTPWSWLVVRIAVPAFLVALSVAQCAKLENRVLDSCSELAVHTARSF